MPPYFDIQNMKINYKYFFSFTFCKDDKHYAIVLNRIKTLAHLTSPESHNCTCTYRNGFSPYEITLKEE